MADALTTTGSAPVPLAIDGGSPIRPSRLPLSRPWLGPEEAEAAAEAVRSGCGPGDGPECRRTEGILAGILGVPRTLFMNSCTSALEAAVYLSGVGHGDEVVLPSFTFVSCANAVIRAGGRPVFADVDPDTMNLDPASVERVLTARTRAVIVVHYAGRMSGMDDLVALCRRRGIRLIEDAAHALGAQWGDQPAGTVGDFGCFSFHGTKDVICGEGGALVCRDPADMRRAEILREKGTNRSAFLRGEVDRYTWVAEGGSFVAAEVLAAILRIQLGRLPAILARKRELAEALTEGLQPIRHLVTLPDEWPGMVSSWHLYPVLMPAAHRDGILAALQAEGVGATFHYVSLHSSPFARSTFGYRELDLPHTNFVSDSLVRLPLFPTMTDRDLDDVAAAARKVIPAILGARP